MHGVGCEFCLVRGLAGRERERGRERGGIERRERERERQRGGREKERERERERERGNRKMGTNNLLNAMLKGLKCTATLNPQMYYHAS